MRAHMCEWRWVSPIQLQSDNYPDSKIQEANIGPIWGRQDPVVPHVGPMNFAIWVYTFQFSLPILIRTTKQII